MTRNILIFLISITISISSFSQSKIGVINDKDGYTNLRILGDKNSSVLGKIKEGVLFNYFEQSDLNWWIVETLEGEIGYIHKSRILFKENGYLYNDKIIKSEVRLGVNQIRIKDITAFIYQIKSKNYPYFTCKATIKTFSSNNKIIDTKYYNIEPVGGNYGISFDINQKFRNIIVASKFGDYEGELIIIGINGEIKSYLGGSYFVTEDKKYIISSWDSDLSGVTIYDIDNANVYVLEELDFYLGKWKVKNNIYFSNILKNGEESNETFQINLKMFSLKKSKLPISGGLEVLTIKNKDCNCQ